MLNCIQNSNEKITEENASEKVGLVVRELLIHSTKLERELADANKLLALINKCAPDLIRDCHRVERLTADRDAALVYVAIALVGAALFF